MEVETNIPRKPTFPKRIHRSPRLLLRPFSRQGFRPENAKQGLTNGSAKIRAIKSFRARPRLSLASPIRAAAVRIRALAA